MRIANPTNKYYSRFHKHGWTIKQIHKAITFEIEMHKDQQCSERLIFLLIEKSKLKGVIKLNINNNNSTYKQLYDIDYDYADKEILKESISYKIITDNYTIIKNKLF